MCTGNFCFFNNSSSIYILKLSEENEIKHQLFRSRGGTDAGAAQYVGIGTLSTTLGVPGRYIHSPATMIDLEDLEAVKEIAKKIIETFDDEKLKDLLN